MDHALRMFVDAPASVDIVAPAGVEIVQPTRHLPPPDLGGGVKVMIAEPAGILEDVGHSRVAAAAAESAQSTERGLLYVDIGIASSLDLSEMSGLAKIVLGAGLSEVYVHVDKAR